MRRNSVIFVAFVGVCFLTITGCAVLTNSQVQEVKRFSEATSAYTQLPGTLARSYGTLLRDCDLLTISRHEFNANDPEGVNEAWDKIVSAYGKEQELGAAGENMDSALNVLKQYSQILSQLVADDYTNALGKSSEHLGTSLDNSINAYNKQATNPLPNVGGPIAGAIRFAGGLYIRNRQAQILRDVIKEANPLVQGLMVDVRNIAEKMAKDYESYETTHLETPFKEIVKEKGKLEVTTIQAVYDDLSRARAGKALAEKVEKAATTYAAAHQALVNKTRERKDLKELIAEIQTLRDEVKAAQDIKAKVDK
jgi:hypothetical protein